MQWTTLIYLLGCQIRLPEVLWYPVYPKQIVILTKIIGYQKTSGKLIWQRNKYIRVAHWKYIRVPHGMLRNRIYRPAGLLLRTPSRRGVYFWGPLHGGVFISDDPFTWGCSFLTTPWRRGVFFWGPLHGGGLFLRTPPRRGFISDDPLHGGVRRS